MVKNHITHEAVHKKNPPIRESCRVSRVKRAIEHSAQQGTLQILYIYGYINKIQKR